LVYNDPVMNLRYFFYFQGDTLKVKAVDLGIEAVGDCGSKQEQLDNQKEATIATGLQVHKVAANVNPQGEITVYYLTGSGFPTASISKAGADSWKPLKNW
jgi:hypothetical protein